MSVRKLEAQHGKGCHGLFLLFFYSHISHQACCHLLLGLFSQGYWKFSFMQDIRPKKGGPLAGPRLVKRGGVPTSSYDGHLPTTLNHAFAM